MLCDRFLPEDGEEIRLLMKTCSVYLNTDIELSKEDMRPILPRAFEFERSGNPHTSYARWFCLEQRAQARALMYPALEVLTHPFPSCADFWNVRASQHMDLDTCVFYMACSVDNLSSARKQQSKPLMHVFSPYFGQTMSLMLIAFEVSTNSTSIVHGKVFRTSGPFVSI
jgi:hypothetical protein